MFKSLGHDYLSRCLLNLFPIWPMELLMLAKNVIVVMMIMGLKGWVKAFL